MSTHPPLNHRLGLTKSRAGNFSKQGYGHHAYIPLNQARPKLSTNDFRMAQIRDEQVVLYSFASAQECVEFMESHAAVGLNVEP